MIRRRRMNSSNSSKSSWCKIDSGARSLINSVPQTAATTSAFSAAFILLLSWLQKQYKLRPCKDDILVQFYCFFQILFLGRFFYGLLLYLAGWECELVPDSRLLGVEGCLHLGLAGHTVHNGDVYLALDNLEEKMECTVRKKTHLNLPFAMFKATLGLARKHSFFSSIKQTKNCSYNELITVYLRCMKGMSNSGKKLLYFLNIWQ